MPSPPPSTIAFIRQIDRLVRDLYRLDQDRRRKLVTGLAHRLVQESGTGLNVVVVDKTELNDSLDNVLSEAVSLARTGLADPEIEDDVIDTVIARTVEMAADLPRADAKRLAMWVERVGRW